MEKEAINYNLEDLARYRPAALAVKFYQDKNETAAEGALEKLIGTLEVSGKDGSVMLKGIKEMKEGNKILTNMFAPKYEEIKLDSKVKDLFNFYSGYFKEYITGDSYSEAARVFGEYGNETYRDMLDKVIGAQETLSSKRPNISDEDKSKAKEILMKYQRIVAPIEYFEELEMEKLSNPILKVSMKKNFTQMFKPQEKKE